MHPQCFALQEAQSPEQPVSLTASQRGQRTPGAVKPQRGHVICGSAPGVGQTGSAACSPLGGVRCPASFGI